MRRKLTVFLIIVLLAAFGLASSCGLFQPPTPKPETSLPADFNRLGEVWQILSQDYVNKEALDPKKLSDGAIRGMLEALNDPHTDYLDAGHYQLWQTSITGSFEGIGAVVNMEDGKLTVVAPISGSPAERAGVRTGDSIMEVDGQTTSGLTLMEAILKIRGPKGTKVTLTILHQGEAAPEKVEIIREEIQLDSVTLKMLEGIAVIRLASFSERTSAELEAALEEARGKGARALILDLRDNPGGLLEQAVAVASQFLKDGVVLYEADSKGERKEWKVKGGGLATDLPMVVLVNRGSASGSEVVAGALQDRGRAPLIGTKTYGKGSINRIRDLSDGSVVYVTYARWLTPKGRVIEGQGLEPDVEVTISQEDREQGKDPQMERAIRDLLSRSPASSSFRALLVGEG